MAGALAVGTVRLGVGMMMMMVGMVVTRRMMIDVLSFVRMPWVLACFGTVLFFRCGKLIQRLTARGMHGDKSPGTMSSFDNP